MTSPELHPQSPTAVAHPQIPLERYREILAAIESERDSWVEDFWLRFAAHAAVLCPGTAAEVAQGIRDDAGVLHQHAGWYRKLASSARFVVAAMLRQHHIPVIDFLIDHARIGRMLREVGLRHGDFHETMTVLILRITPRAHPLSMLDIERLKALYDQMKRFHWWLTGPEDLPACAALARNPGSAETVVAQAEAAYQQLHADGLMTGDDLQTAANLLPLAGPHIDTTIARYRDLKHALEQRLGKLDTSQYDALAVLTLLDQPAERVVDVLHAVRHELDLLQPQQKGMANFIIAADLTFLDLVRQDRDRHPHSDEAGLEAMQRTLHAFHLASAVLVSQVDVSLVAPVGLPDQLGWPYGIA